MGDKKYDFEPIDVFSSEGRKVMASYSPTARIPILVDDQTVVWDSLLITQYLLGQPISVEVQKALVLVNEITDAGVQLFQLRKFAVDPEDESIFSKNNLSRLSAGLGYFENNLPGDWGLAAQWLYCTLDWFAFRSIYDWQNAHKGLVAFYHENTSKPHLAETDPRSPKI